MCMIIDANTIPCVFSCTNQKHNDFKPVLKWLIYGKAKLNLGGKLLTKEIAEKQKSYMPFLLELNKFNKIHMFKSQIIDNKEKEIKQKESDPDFDDPHIIALSIISNTQVIVTDDARAFKFLKKIKEYDKNANVPKIYTTIEHSPHTELLVDTNICKNGNHEILKKEVADKLWEKIEHL